MFRLEIPYPRLPRELSDALQPALQELAPEFVAAARDGWPVDTGNSRDAFRSRASEKGLEIVNDAKTPKGKAYVEHVHRAGVKTPAVAEAAARMHAVASERVEPLAAAIAARLKQEG